MSNFYAGDFISDLLQAPDKPTAKSLLDVGSVTQTELAATINSATVDTAILDADQISLTETAAGGALRRATFATVWNWIAARLAALTSITVGGAWNFGSTTRPTSSGTGTPAANSLITRADADANRIDFGQISLRDDFLSVVNGATSNISELGWSRLNQNGAGSLRPSHTLGDFGVLGLITQAVFRAAQLLTFEGNNASGNFGFFLTFLANTSTRVVTRFMISSLNCRMDFGFGPNIMNQAGARKFVLNYTQQPAAWAPNTAIQVGQFRRPTTSNGRRYYASVAGTTAATEPTWPTGNGATVVDGGVTWVEYGREGGPNFVLMQHSVAGETNGVIVDTGIPVVANTWYVVTLEFVSGSQWRWTINGTPVNITVGSIASNHQFIYHIENTDNVANALAIDYFGATSRISR